MKIDWKAVSYSISSVMLVYFDWWHSKYFYIYTEIWKSIVFLLTNIVAHLFYSSMYSIKQSVTAFLLGLK